MAKELAISIGQCSMAGRKESNQDFYGALIPSRPALSLKGISVVLADGISSSDVSQIAAESAVKSFLTDYYCTSETWSVKTSAIAVLRAINSWLFAQTRRGTGVHDMDRGYVCTFSALVLKGRTAHLFHVGDSRIYRLSGGSLEQLTQDHRNVVSSVQSYLTRALGMAQSINIDYRSLPLAVGDTFVLATDGVSDHCPKAFMAEKLRTGNLLLETAAEEIAGKALENGSDDNLTIQVVRVDGLPDGDAQDAINMTESLPAPPLLQPGQEFEGYKVLRALHENYRSHVYLVEDMDTGEKAALKIPSVDMREDREALRRFMMEDWIAHRIQSAHVLKALPQTRARNYVYSVTEFVEGQTLAQWMTDNPNCDLETMRGIVEQIAKGLRAFHRKEMLHRDLRPENIMIDRAGTVKIIDFGATAVAGVTEAHPFSDDGTIPGTLQYAAPEYLIGAAVGRRSDYFSLGVIAYQMLTGELPYGAAVSRVRTRSQLRRLQYRSAICRGADIPHWVDRALERAVHPDPGKRFEALSEFTAALRKPSGNLVRGDSVSLAQRDPVRFWQAISAVLALIVLVLLAHS